MNKPSLCAVASCPALVRSVRDVYCALHQDKQLAIGFSKKKCLACRRFLKPTDWIWVRDAATKPLHVRCEPSRRKKLLKAERAAIPGLPMDV